MSKFKINTNKCFVFNLVVIKIKNARKIYVHVWYTNIYLRIKSKIKIIKWREYCNSAHILLIPPLWLFLRFTSQLFILFVIFAATYDVFLNIFLCSLFMVSYCLTWIKKYNHLLVKDWRTPPKIHSFRYSWKSRLETHKL